MSSVLVGVAFSCPAEGALDEEAQSCIAAFQKGQDQRYAGKLLQARDSLAGCARKQCPDVVRDECIKLASDVDDAIPSLIVKATDPGRNAISNTQVFVDGALLEGGQAGRPREANPGQHTIRVQAPGYEALERTVRLPEGSRRQTESFVLQPVASADAQPVGEDAPGSGTGIPTAAWVAGGVGVAGLATFGIFAARGLSQEGDLEDCKPNCNAEKIDRARSSYRIADIGLVVGAVGLGAATYVILSGPDRSARGRGVAVHANAAPGAGFAALSGRF